MEAAIDDVVRLTLELTSAIATLAHAEAARLRNQLERALSRAQFIAESLPQPSKRSLERIDEMRTVALGQLAIAPAPSSAAIEAAEAGDHTIWNREARAWILRRLASRAPSRNPRRRAQQRDTRPDTPMALRASSGDADPDDDDTDAAIPGTSPPPDPSPDPARGKARTR
jgi:hypothetical protein